MIACPVPGMIYPSRKSLGATFDGYVLPVRAANIKRSIIGRMAVRSCVVSFTDVSGIRHSVDVDAESLYEAAILAIKRFRKDPWVERVGDGTVIEVEIREPSTTHALSVRQIERWLSSATRSPADASKKAKLKMMLVQS